MANPDRGVAASSKDLVSTVQMTAGAGAQGDVQRSPASGTGEELVLPERYEDLGPIASGGSGDVRRVRDRQLDRVAAMKLLRPEHVGSERMRARFLGEARITAELDHPGIVAVYERGELPSGRLWYVMKEVRGRTFSDVIHELHEAKSPDGFREAPSGWTFRRLVDAFARVAQAVAYAHDRGVVHRDLKPANLMVGLHGEVLVMDWGLARRVGRDDEDDGESDAVGSDRPFLWIGAPEEQLTQIGDVIGTPAYMSPEQARGRRDLHGPRSDVYSLGAILYTLLAGQRPYARQHGLAVWRAVIAGPPEPLSDVVRGGAPVPFELIAICERAMQPEIEARHADAGEVAREVLWWLDGAQRREQALSLVEKARRAQPEIAALHEAEARAKAEARALLGGIRPYEPVERKRPGWEREDEAARLRREAVLRETEWLQEIHGALSLDPELPEAHALLSDHYRERLAEAERAHDEDDAARFEALLRTHDRGQHASFLRGDGAVTLVTDPEGAEVFAERYVLRDRRLVPEPFARLGRAPLREAVLPRGSYLLRIRGQGRAEVRYPVLIERGGHWDGVAPGEREPFPIALPEEGELGEDECYVPAGWCWIGGDPMATDSLPSQRVWIDAFIMKRFPVTNAEYLSFLNDLLGSGREVEARAACPIVPLGIADSGEHSPVFPRDGGNRFVLPPDPVWRADSPVVQLDWFQASKLARWVAGRERQPWRLPNELEREKAARGADRRRFPWGDHAVATFACVAEAREGAAMRERVSGYPTDESPYGIRGLSGNVRDWCINVWRHTGPELLDGRLSIDAASTEDPEFRVIKGGFWGGSLVYGLSAGRFAGRPGLARLSHGVRLVRSRPRDR